MDCCVSAVTSPSLPDDLPTDSGLALARLENAISGVPGAFGGRRR